MLLESNDLSPTFPHKSKQECRTQLGETLRRKGRNLEGYWWRTDLKIMLRKETLGFLKCRSESRSGSLKQGKKIGKCPSEQRVIQVFT